MPIPKSSNLRIPAKRFRLIALTSCDPKLTERSVLSRLTSSASVSDDPLQFAYKPNKSTLDAIASSISLNLWMRLPNLSDVF